MPATTNIEFLIWLFAHLSNLRIVLYRREESVDVYLTLTLRKGNVSLRG